MSLHAAHPPAISLPPSFLYPAGVHDGAQHDGQQHDHCQATRKLGGDELPAD
jgi:hypothetical protein